MRVSVSFEWQRAGEVRLRGGALGFPPLTDAPGAYRFRFSGHGTGGSYVGEASQLRRRAHDYAKPGPSQTTGIRMNAEMREHLASGGRIEMSAITEAEIGIEDRAAVLNLAEASWCRLVENAVLRGLRETGLERMLNRPGVGESW
jgi:hypothetical protein